MYCEWICQIRMSVVYAVYQTTSYFHPWLLSCDRTVPVTAGAALSQRTQISTEVYLRRLYSPINWG